jgi:hypothetical protein
MMLIGLMVISGCVRTAAPKPATQPATAAVVTKLPPATTATPATRPSIEDQPIRTPAFTEKYDWQLQPGELKYIETSRRTKHKLIVTMNATPAGAKVGVAVVLKTDLDFALEDYKKGGQPKNTVAHDPGSDKVELNAPMSAVLPYGIIVRNFSDDAVAVKLVLKAE